jgi:hypothetical protein
LTKGTNQGGAPARRIAILCMSVAVVALLLVASALPVFAASKKSSDTTNGQTTNGDTTNGDTTSGDTTSGGTVSPDATNKSSDKHSGDKLTNTVKSPSPKNNVQITLTEDGTNAPAGVAEEVIDALPSGFNIKSVKSSYYSCSKSSTDSNAAFCQNFADKQKKATIDIVAKAPKSGKYTNTAEDNYGNVTETPFKVKNHS